jgi:hypothetical protein
LASRVCDGVGVDVAVGVADVLGELVIDDELDVGVGVVVGLGVQPVAPMARLAVTTTPSSSRIVMVDLLPHPISHRHGLIRTDRPRISQVDLPGRESPWG